MSSPSSDFPGSRLAAIVESSDDAIISKDLNGIIQTWNRAAENMFGYTSEEAVGRSILLIIPTERRSEEDEVLRRIRANERVDHFETVRRRKDGSLVEISLTVSPIRDETGRVIGASKIARDISERKRAESAIAELQRRLLALVSASSRILHSPTVEDVQAATVATARDLLTADAYALWRVDSGSNAWRITRSEGISEEFAARLLQSEQVPHAGRAAPAGLVALGDIEIEPLAEADRNAYRTEGVRSMLLFPLIIGGVLSGRLDFYCRRPHGFSPVDAQTGQALANLAAAAISAANLYEATAHDRQRSEFLARSGELLGSSLEYEKTLAAVANLAVPYIADWCAIDLVRENGEVRRLAVAHIDPAKRDLAIRLEERYPADPKSRGSVHQVIRTGQPAMLSPIPRESVAAAARDAEHARLLDELALTSYICVPLVAHSRTLGAMTFVAAESGRHYSVADLQFAQDLAGRMAMAVDNAQAYRQVADASRLKDDFLATLSHELRTPLNAVLGYAKMLGMNVLGPAKHAHAVAVIERNANSLKQIVEDVLDVSRIVSGKLRLQVQPVNLADVVRVAIATIMPAADAKAIRVQGVLDGEVRPISGDPDRLQQVIWNLLSNAVKFTPRGGRVQVRLQRVDSHVEIVVSDTGRGIPREFLPHLFERFRQADSSFAREHGGLGLGLAIVRELVELHGGSVRAASDGSDTGATFTVQLPTLIVHPVQAPDAREHPALDVKGPEAVVHRLDGLTILAVDDEVDAVNLVREILEAAGARVMTASSGAETLRILQEMTPDALVADIGMHAMDGFQLIQRIRQGGTAGGARHVPALALTAYARAQDRMLALGSGFQMHVAKPVDPAELVLAVAAITQRVLGRPGSEPV